MIALSEIPIVPWDDREHSGGAILALPYTDIRNVVEELEGMLEVQPYALLPPYRGEDVTFTSRAASVTRDKFPDYQIVVPVATSRRMSLESFVKALLNEGFRNLAVPYLYGLRGQYRFDHLMQFLHGVYDDSVWFHVAGGRPDIPDGWEGIWSWSQEEL